MIKGYLKQTEQNIGKRTPGEIAHCDVVGAGLEMAVPIEAALQTPLRSTPLRRCHGIPAASKTTLRTTIT